MNDAYTTTRVIDLLMERDRAFMDVHHAEKQIQRILGAPYPLPPPPKLPSLQKSKTTKKKDAASASPVKVRALRGDEIAYRVHSLGNGEQKTTLQTSQRLLRQVIENQATTPDFRIRKIETLKKDKDGEEIVSEVLFPAT